LKKAAAVVALATVFLCVPSIASSSPFYGTPTGAAKKACLQSGGVWTLRGRRCISWRHAFRLRLPTEQPSDDGAEELARRALAEPTESGAFDR
jgi:hypothetical protein